MSVKITTKEEKRFNVVYACGFHTVLKHWNYARQDGTDGQQLLC